MRSLVLVCSLLVCFAAMLHAEKAGPIEPIDSGYGVWRPLDALCAYLWEGRKTARKIALGGGKAKQRYMGRWPAPDGRRVRRIDVTDKPRPTRSQNYFTWKWDSFLNPRN